MANKINTKKKEQEIFRIYKKNQKKLVFTGGEFNPWFWRNGEVSFKTFGELSIIEKDIHINYLISIGAKNTSTNDDYILKHYGPKNIAETIHYFSIEDNDEIKNLINNLTSTEDVTDTGAPIVDEDVSVGESLSFDNENISTENVIDTGAIIPDESVLMSYGKEYLEEYLNLFFQYQNKHWKDDLKFARTVDSFIENTKNYMLVNDLTIAHIKSYKKL
jgi:hypothetical protein